MSHSMSKSHEPTRRKSVEAFDHHAYKLITIAALLMILVATIVYSTVEDWSVVDSLYFSVVAVTTVGFGDLTPTTTFTKLFTVAYLLTGVGLIATYFNLRTSHRRRKREARFRERGGGSGPNDDA